MTTKRSVIGLDRGRYDAVLFDMDGVITDTARVHANVWKRMFDTYLAEWSARRGVSQPPFAPEDYLAYVDGKPRDEGVVSFLASRGILLPRGVPTDGPAVETVWGLANRKNDELTRVLATEGVEAFPGSVALVRRLQRHGFGTAVISASRNCQAVLDAAGVGDLFPVRVDGNESERLHLAGKPAPDAFLEAARRLHVAPGRAVVVEDAVAGVRAGRAGGFALVIGVDRSGVDRAGLGAGGAHVIVHDLSEVAVGRAA